jgi:hypothetical protein
VFDCSWSFFWLHFSDAVSSAARHFFLASFFSFPDIWRLKQSLGVPTKLATAFTRERYSGFMQQAGVASPVAPITSTPAFNPL